MFVASAAGGPRWKTSQGGSREVWARTMGKARFSDGYAEAGAADLNGGWHVVAVWIATIGAAGES